MTKTHKLLLRFLPRWLALGVLYLWYTTLLFIVIASADVPLANFIYWGH